MISYAIVILAGCIHTDWMVVRVGTFDIMVICSNVRKFIREANVIGVYQALELAPEYAREVLAFMYEKFSDALQEGDPT